MAVTEPFRRFPARWKLLSLPHSLVNVSPFLSALARQICRDPEAIGVQHHKWPLLHPARGNFKTMATQAHQKFPPSRRILHAAGPQF